MIGDYVFKYMIKLELEAQKLRNVCKLSYFIFLVKTEQNIYLQSISEGLKQYLDQEEEDSLILKLTKYFIFFFLN